MPRPWNHGRVYAVLLACDSRGVALDVDLARPHVERATPPHLSSFPRPQRSLLRRGDVEGIRESLRLFAGQVFLRRHCAPKESYEIPEDFSPSAYLADAFGVFTGEEPQRVRLLFKWHTWTAIADRTWGIDQNFTRLEDGSFLLEFTAREATSWSRGYAPLATACASLRLKDCGKK